MPDSLLDTNDTFPTLLKGLAKSFRVIFIFISFTILGCARPNLLDPSKALRVSNTPSISDDLDLDSLKTALQLQIEKTAESGKVFRFGEFSLPAKKYSESLSRLLQVIDSGAAKEQVLEYVETHFTFMEVYGDEDWGEVRVTSYYEPVIRGSRQPTKEFSQPLYSRPPDLLNLNIGNFSERFKDEPVLKARISDDRVVPYYTRKEIDQMKVLANKNLELCYLDPIDAFFLHIQGSGTVQFEDGSESYINYADKNGLRYEPIGKFMRDLITGPITMSAIVRVLRTLAPAVRDAYLYLNPSYVFFRNSNQRAITSSGVPATPGRTIATDSSLFPKGALAFVQFPKPNFKVDTGEASSFTETGRFVFDQDSGGAIRGPARVDLFWGRGPEAGRYAGSVNGMGKLYYLVPR